MDLSAEFEQVKMIEGIKKTKDVEALQMVAIRLVELNFGIKEQVKQMVKIGWMPGQ